MVVEVLQRGGLAGLTRRGSFDTATLPAVAAAQADEALRRLVADPARSGTPQPDRFVYDLTIRDGVTATSVELAEHDVPAALQPFVADAIAHGHIV